MNNRPLISIIVPIYRNEQDLQECIESLIKQTYQNLEIILVDDGSPDKCPQICDQYAEIDSRIKVIHKSNGGLVSGRKAGIEKSIGTYIGYVDGDDWIEPDFYEELYKSISGNNADIVAAGYRRDIEDVTEIIQNNVPCKTYEGMERIELYKRMVCAGDFFYFGIYSYVWNKLFKREVLFESQMQVDDRIFVGEDVLCVFHAMMKAEKINVIDNASYHYRQRAGSILKTLDSQKLEDMRIEALSQGIDRFLVRAPYFDILSAQFERYLKGIRMIRTYYNFEKDTTCWYPFGDIRDGERIAIYSAGTFGQNFYNRLINAGKCKFAGLFDEDYKEYRIQGIPVNSPEKIRRESFDKIMIASLDNRYIKRVRKKLANLGVKEEQIVAIV